MASIRPRTALRSRQSDDASDVEEPNAHIRAIDGIAVDQGDADPAQDVGATEPGSCDAVKDCRAVNGPDALEDEGVAEDCGLAAVGDWGGDGQLSDDGDAPQSKGVIPGGDSPVGVLGEWQCRLEGQSSACHNHALSTGCKFFVAVKWGA